MSEDPYLNQAEALRLLEESLPGFTVTVERAGGDPDDADVYFMGPDGRRSPWSMLLWGDDSELLLNFENVELRSELAITQYWIQYCAKVILATAAGRYVHTTSRWRDRLAVTLDDGSLARWRTWPGSGRGKAGT